MALSYNAPLSFSSIRLIDRPFFRWPPHLILLNSESRFSSVFLFSFCGSWGTKLNFLHPPTVLLTLFLFAKVDIISCTPIILCSHSLLLLSYSPIFIILFKQRSYVVNVKENYHLRLDL